MRILIAHTKAEFLNPTQDYLYEAIENAGDVEYYGPDYQHVTEDFLSLREFCRINSPFDLVDQSYRVEIWDDGNLILLDDQTKV